jgi:uncharacterized protein YjgD (DUF1641 family)
MTKLETLLEIKQVVERLPATSKKLEMVEFLENEIGKLSKNRAENSADKRQMLQLLYEQDKNAAFSAAEIRAGFNAKYGTDYSLQKIVSLLNQPEIKKEIKNRINYYSLL